MIEKDISLYGILIRTLDGNPFMYKCKSKTDWHVYLVKNQKFGFFECPCGMEFTTVQIAAIQLMFNIILVDNVSQGYLYFIR